MSTIKDQIWKALNAQLDPSHLDVINESAGHNVPPESETHFKLIVVSSKFSNILPVKRHKMIYRILDSQLQNGVHALAMHLYTPDEWRKQSNLAPESPNCLGGGNKEKSIDE